MSSKVGFHYFTIFIRIFYPHKCPQKLVFITLLYLWRYFFITNVLKSWFSLLYYIYKDIYPHKCPQKLVFITLLFIRIFYPHKCLKSWFSTFYYICEDILSLRISSNVSFRYFTIFIRICFLHKCPQKLFSNILLCFSTEYPQRLIFIIWPH